MVLQASALVLMRAPLALLVAGLMLSGCASLVPVPSGTPEVDSLRAENAALRDQTRHLRDSLAFYDDVATGRYYRDLRALKDQINRLEYELQTRRDGGQTVSVYRASRLFEPASARLTERGAARLQKVAAQLRTAYPTRAILVEGHTDDVPVGPDLAATYPTNWELSGARATTVVRALIEMSGLSPDQFAAVAYGATRPVASNDTERGRRRNRRVRVAVLPVPRDFSRPFETSW
jgi:chemotaxis protein MotB